MVKEPKDFFKHKEPNTFAYMSERLSTIVSLAINSLKLDDIKIIEPHKIFHLRPTIHVLLSAPIGATKSTILNEIADVHNVVPILGLTRAGLVGTTNENQFIPPEVWNCRNKPFLLDEFSTGGGDHVNPFMPDLLHLLESEYFKRKGSFKGSYQEGDFEKKKKDYLILNNGIIEVKARFAGIFATMYNIKMSNSKVTQALITRCVPYHFFPNRSILREVAHGNKFYNFKSYLKGARYLKKTTIKRADYLIIEDFVNKQTMGNDIIYLRSIGDCCRVFAILKKHHLDLYQWIIGQKGFFS